MVEEIVKEIKTFCRNKDVSVMDLREKFDTCYKLVKIWLTETLVGLFLVSTDTEEIITNKRFDVTEFCGFYSAKKDQLLEYAEKAIDAFLEQEARKEATAELQKQLEQYKSVFGDILFPAEPGTAEFEQRREIQENPAGRWMYSDDGFYWKLVPQDTGKIDFSRVMLRKLPDSVFVGVNQDVCMNPEDYLYSFNFGMSWDDLYGCDWIYHSAGRKAWFKRKEEKR